MRVRYCNRDYVYLLFFIPSQLASAPYLRLIPYRVALIFEIGYDRCLCPGGGRGKALS